MSSMKSFCWIRTLAVDAKATEPSERTVVAPCSALRTKAGGRPPDTVASNVLLSSSTARAADEDCTHEAKGYRFWIAPEAHFGRVQADTVFDYGPAFDCEAAALEWITTQDGQQWEKNASNRFLMGFGVCADDAVTRVPVPDLPGIDNKNRTPRQFLFDKVYWGREASRAHLPRRNPAELYLDSLDDLECQPIDHSATGRELAALVLLQTSQEQKKGLIGQQAQSMRHAIAPVLQAAGVLQLLLETPKGQELVALVADTVDPVIYLNKRYFMRARPGHLRHPELRPMFGDTGSGPDRLNPGHPSYPSGHATQAHVWAGLLSFCGKDPDGKAEQAANDVARNREIAGLHFESDSTAGRALAKEIVKRMLVPASNRNYMDLIQRLTDLGLKP